MIKAFPLNERGKIELTVGELNQIIDDAVEEGRKSNSVPYYPYCPSMPQPIVPYYSGDFTCTHSTGHTPREGAT